MPRLIPACFSQDKIWEVFGEVLRSDEDMHEITGKPDPERTM
jgi:hypothetical protein